jgi:uncharacterized RDD family membrane protein YckC
MTAGPEAAAAATGSTAPGLARRMAAFVYEGVLLFGVVFMAGYIYSTLTQQRHALQGQTGLQVFVFGVLGLYFVTFWTRGGQTVAMRAWQLRVVDVAGQPLTTMRAAARYLASWLWFVPALLAARLAGLHSAAQIFTLMAVGVVAYALLTRLHPERQFLHDALCGTRLVRWHPAPARRAQSGR